jgi:N-acetylglucosamine kinase-like BadF-type ATPase
MPRYFLGIDTGATKSHALIAAESGQALGFGQGGSGNPDMIGHDGLTALLRDIVEQALTAAGTTIDQLGGAGFGVAGYDWPSQRQSILQAIEPLGLGQIPLDLVNDALIGLLAGAAAGWGVCIVAGTGCNCYGLDQNGRVGRVTGYGTWMGEAAGASELVYKAIEAVALEWTCRGPATDLTQAFIELTGAASLADLLEGLNLARYQLKAAAAPVVFHVAAEGDPVARSLIEWAGHELGSLAIGIIRQLGIEALAFDVVLAGSFYNGSPTLIDVIGQTIHEVAPGARLVRLSAPPVVGGVLLGMAQAGLNPTPLRETLIQSTNELLRDFNQREIGDLGSGMGDGGLGHAILDT